MKEKLSCPDLETLSSFIDGRLRWPKKAAVLNHLDHCPRCGELVSGAFRFLDETEPLESRQTRRCHGILAWLFPWPAMVGGLAALGLLVLVGVVSSERAYRRGLAFSRAFRETRLAQGKQPTRFDLPLPPPDGQSPRADPMRGDPLAPPDGNLGQAIEAFREISPYSPAWRRARMRLVSLYILSGNLARARVEAAALAERYPRDAETLGLDALSRYLYAREKNLPEEMAGAVSKMSSLRAAFPGSVRIEKNLTAMLESQR